MKTIERRMTELAIQCWRGQYEDTIALAHARDIVTERDGDTIKFKHAHNNPSHNQASIPTAITRGMDPISISVCLVFAFFGIFWTSIISTKEVKRAWKEEEKER